RVGMLGGYDAGGAGRIVRTVAPQSEPAEPVGDLAATREHLRLAPLRPGLEVEPERGVEPDDARAVERAETKAPRVRVEIGRIREEVVPVHGAVLPAAHRREPFLECFRDVEEGGALHPEHPLLRAAREEVHRRLPHVEPERAETLDGVYAEDNAALATERAERSE